MNYEHSCGAIVFTRHTGQPLYVIVQEKKGAYSFPKGHMEAGETEEETARREVAEEIGLEPVFIPGFRETDEYALRERPGWRKQVVYFLSEYPGGELTPPRPHEIRRIRLLPCEEALELFEHEGTRRVLTNAHRFILEYMKA